MMPRPPRTMSKALMPDDDVPELNDMNFPAFGRGKPLWPKVDTAVGKGNAWSNSK